ncbi:MAG: methylated-DNA--[protein]-cysteine S-methyltransferase [Candidatus Eremiobacteraeota bacterium]|nr:methylated-DNA--[protein]-cysteine S-methyltransferase [Candidatus Eremiobacteraeota bacterium]
MKSVVSATIATPFGLAYYLEACDDAITFGSFKRTKRLTRTHTQPLLREAVSQIKAYFRRRLRRFDLPLSYGGTPLQHAAWSAICDLEFGHLVSYADVARAINKPHAHRAVAAAMAITPIDLLIPAHRVLGSDGRIKGAGPRSPRARLIRFENPNYSF